MPSVESIMQSLLRLNGCDVTFSSGGFFNASVSAPIARVWWRCVRHLAVRPLSMTPASIGPCPLAFKTAELREVNTSMQLPATMI
eukprot:4920381-Amphidinium_carterae.1